MKDWRLKYTKQLRVLHSQTQKKNHTQFIFYLLLFGVAQNRKSWTNNKKNEERKKTWDWNWNASNLRLKYAWMRARRSRLPINACKTIIMLIRICLVLFFLISLYKFCFSNMPHWKLAIQSIHNVVHAWRHGFLIKIIVS